MDQGFKDAYARLNSAQRQAVDQIEGPVLVVAGPGTGKTQLLSLRIANILRTTDSLPENILCLTFTDSAVHTMRERLSSIIGQAAYGVTISTYHAFGSELLRRYPDYFVDEADLLPADDLSLDATLRQVVEKLPYSNPLKHEIYLRDVKQLISDCKRALITPDDLRAVAAANEKFIASASNFTKESSAELNRVSKSSVTAFSKLLDIKDSTAYAPKTTSGVLSLASLWHSTLDSAINEFIETGKTQALSKWKLRWLAKDSDGLFIVDGATQNAKLRAGATIYEDYLSSLEVQGLYDYDDMVLRAIRGLSANPELTYTLQERYLYILLDEFQDTNAAQARLVELLTDNPVNEGRPNVLAVGDDDQAIYAFQGAHYSHMLNFRSHYRDVSLVTLTENYRSHQDILDLSGAIASQIETRLEKQFPEINKDIKAVSSELPGKSIIGRYEFKSSLSQNSWVTQRIAELVANGLPYKEIAILAPKHEYLQSLIPFLSQVNIPIHYDRREDVLEDPTIGQLTTMARLVLALEADDSASGSLWSRVLSYEFWSLPTSLLWQIAWQARDERRSWTEVLLEKEKTRPIALFFIRLSQQTSSEPLEQMIDLLIGTTELNLQELDLISFRSPFTKFYFGEGTELQTSNQAFWQLLSNLTVLRERVRDYRKAELSPLLLQDFLAFVGAHQAAGIKVLNTNPYQEALDAVELMTAYRAKGQEYTAVFLLATNDEVWGTKARAMGSRLSLPANLAFIRYAGATDDERLRLLYVALTRAKSQLYLTNYESTYSGRPTTHLKYLDESVDEAGELVSPLLPNEDRQVALPDVKIIPSLADVQLQWNHQHLSALKEADMRAMLEPRLKRYQLGPTELNTFLDATRDGPANFFLRILLRFPAPTTPSIEYGNTMHETLEWIHLQFKKHKKLPTTAEAITAFSQSMRRKRLSETQTDLLIARGEIALTAYLTQRSQTVSRDAYSEYSFRNEGVFVGSAHLTGKVDKLLVDHNAKTIIIVDYKTGKSHTKWDQSIKLHFYRHQLYFYKLLVEHSRTFRGYKVIDAYLEFVEPADDGLIQELHIDFDEQKQQNFVALIENVWKLISELDFPDVTNYSDDIKGIEQFESDLTIKNLET
jgi:DNA helicase-2/ATP-dependent DNA helicase PcrA